MLPSRARVYRIAFAALALSAIATQFSSLARNGTVVPANFFSYFTIQSNLIGASVFMTPRAPSSGLRGAAVLYLTVTFIVFALLLSGTDVDTAIPWVNTVLHTVFPLVVIADWIVGPPESPLTFRRSLVWLVYPLAWTGYTLVRGALTGWYPYPFLNPANGGYGSVTAYVAAIIALGVLLCAAIVMVGNRKTGFRVKHGRNPGS